MSEVQILATVVCRETFVREAVTEALSEAGITVAASLGYLGGDQASPPQSDVCIYVASGHSDRNCMRDSAALEQVPSANWIVLCESKANAVFRMLRDRGFSVSAAPLDVSRGDLAYLASLASRGRRFFVDALCDPGPTRETQMIQDADLEPDQWQLLRCLIEGYSNKHIARTQGCDENVVKARIRALLAKLKVQNRTQAAVLAARAGLAHMVKTPPTAAGPRGGAQVHRLTA